MTSAETESHSRQLRCVNEGASLTIYVTPTNPQGRATIILSSRLGCGIILRHLRHLPASVKGREGSLKNQHHHNLLRLTRLGIDTHDEAVVYMRKDCHICRAEGFTAHARILIRSNGNSVIATLNTTSDNLLPAGHASLSESAWERLDAKEGDLVSFEHPRTVDSLSYVRAKIYGHRLDDAEFDEIMRDIVAGQYSDIELSSFVTACSSRDLNRDEMIGLTRAMINVGDHLDWGTTPIVDKHCIGGLPGNRTTPIVVAIVAACGLVMPKTSSRAITSPAGTADTMETLAPVDLSLDDMRRVVDREGGCVVWGGAVGLSPADDLLIRVERALDIDSEGQLVASVLSKKAAAGATHLVLDLPMGPTAKVRSQADATSLAGSLLSTSRALDIKARTIQTDGTQPVGRGIGPALEAWDVLAVLQNKEDAPADLRERALHLAGSLLELAGYAPDGEGIETAGRVLTEGKAWEKFQRICEAQGGMREPPRSHHQSVIKASHAGLITNFDNRRLSRTAKLAGAPHAKASGLEMHCRLGQTVAAGEPLFTLHAETHGELNYAMGYVRNHPLIIEVK